MKHESDGDANRNWCARYNHQRIDAGTGRLGDKRTNGGHPNYCIIKIGQITEKSCGNLKRPAVTQTPVGNHQLMMV